MKKSHYVNVYYVIFKGEVSKHLCIISRVYCISIGSSDGTMRVWDAKDIADDVNIDEEPPPAPPAAVVDDGLEKELEKLETEECELEETPEDGIIDDDSPQDEEEQENDDEENDEENDDKEKNDVEEEVLTSG